VSNSGQVEGQTKSTSVLSSKVLFALLGAPSITVNPVSLKDVELKTQVKFSAMVRCDLPFEYQWFQDGIEYGAKESHPGFTPNAEGVREGEVSLEFEAIPARRGSYTLEVSNASGFAKSAPRTLEVRLWSTRFLQNSWAGYNFTKDNVTKELDPGTYNFIANSGLDKTFPASVSLDDTLMVSYADGYTYKWYGRNESTPLPVPSGPTLKLTSAIKTYGPNYRLMMTKGAIKVTLVFTFSVGTTKSQDVDAKFVGDLGGILCDGGDAVGFWSGDKWRSVGFLQIHLVQERRGYSHGPDQYWLLHDTCRRNVARFKWHLSRRRNLQG
jgi:hypothetical protein